jgi:hypothetical protein
MTTSRVVIALGKEDGSFWLQEKGHLIELVTTNDDELKTIPSETIHGLILRSHNSQTKRDWKSSIFEQKHQETRTSYKLDCSQTFCYDLLLLLVEKLVTCRKTIRRDAGPGVWMFDQSA